LYSRCIILNQGPSTELQTTIALKWIGEGVLNFIGIDGLTVCILYGEISNFHSRVMGLYSSNCRRFFVCRAVNWEPLGQFTSNFAQLLELIVLRSVYFLVKFRFFIPQSSNLATSPTAQASKITVWLVKFLQHVQNLVLQANCMWRKMLNSNNYAKFEVNWPRGSQFTARHTKNHLQFDE
jgi:hypothetical protein